MSSPVLSTKLFKPTMQSVRKPMPFEPVIKRALDLVFQLFLPGKKVLAALANAMLLEFGRKDLNSSSPAAT